MSTESYIKETIANLRNELNQVWSAAFISGGGALSMLLIEINPWLRWSLFVFGLFWAFVFFSSYFIKRDNLIYWTDKLEKGGKNGVYK
jgi:tellurite resistance protein TehA-like permease